MSSARKRDRLVLAENSLGDGVSLVDPADEPRWDTFVTAHPRGTAYHLSGWATVMRRSYGFRPLSLTLRGKSPDQLAGVFPLNYKRGPVSGSRLKSLPVATYGGPL